MIVYFGRSCQNKGFLLFEILLMQLDYIILQTGNTVEMAGGVTFIALVKKLIENDCDITFVLLI